MITIRPSDERGLGEHGGWLKSRHTFSFANYHDPRHMGFRALRVINEDRVKPGAGFDSHGHRDMEIITYVLDGALEHKDSLGTGSVIRPGEIQRMSAGTGIVHSEYNHSKDKPVHFLQIWIMPERAGIAPGYDQRDFPAAERRGRLRLVAARDGRDGALTVHQDVELYSALLKGDEKVSHGLGPGRHAWLHVARGAVSLNGHDLEAGDGAAASDESRLDIAAAGEAEILLFDLA